MEVLDHKNIKMCRLTDEQLNIKMDFIHNYMDACNPATASVFDSNANVVTKNVGTLMAEMNKDIRIQIKRKLVTSYMPDDIAKKYIEQLEAHEIYCHDESQTVLPYCLAATIYPFIEHGLKFLGGDSKAPKHLSSFNGGFTNLLFALSSQVAGAVATPEYLLYFDAFARLDYGDNYLEEYPDIVKQELQQVVYALNQPASARGVQCVTEDTQLWTPDGFKYLYELHEGDECYTWKDGKFVKSKIDKLNIADYDGELLQFKGRHIQETVTPNHRVLYKVPNTNNKYELKEAKELFGHSKLSIPVAADNNFEDYPMSDELLSLCTFALTDGCFDDNKNSGIYRLRYYMSRNRNGLKILTNALDKLGIYYSITDREGSYGSVAVVTLTEVDSQIIVKQLKYHKNKIPGFFKLLSQRQANLVIDRWAMTDGQNNHNGIMLQCDSFEIAQELQEIVLLAGKGSTIIANKNKKFDGSVGETIYVRIFKRTDKRVSEYNKIHYKGKIWCPTTKEGVVIFRENNMIPYISGNSVFWNISIYDKYYYKALFENVTFPGNVKNIKPNWNTVNKLQQFFLKWFNEERTKAILTFPVVTIAMLHNEKEVLDKEYEELWCNEVSKGNAFFTYLSNTVDSLSSCCRLRNNISDQINDFQYSLGAGGIQTGSINVITLNMNRFVQNCAKEWDEEIRKSKEYGFIPYMLNKLEDQVKLMHKYQLGFRALFQDFINKKMMPIYDARFIDIKKQYVTIGINGVLESAEYLGFKGNYNKDYISYLQKLFSTISEANKESSINYDIKINCELVPAEGLGVKFAKWDKKDGYVVPRDCYNSYLYPMEDELISPISKLYLHGKEVANYMDGGSACHISLNEYPTKETCRKFLNIAVKSGCPYFCTNVKVTICNDCGYINKHTKQYCIKCGSKNIDYATRIIGYLKRISNFSYDRQLEEHKRYYHAGI